MTAAEPVPRTHSRARRIFGALGILIAAASAGFFFYMSPPPSAQSPEVPAYTLQVVRELPHDPQAFTQGLLWHDGHLIESTGIRRRSSVRRVNPETGDVVAQRNLDDSFFGEGLARVGDRLLQLTWHGQVALLWNATTLEPEGRLPYQGEGWGLCHDGTRLVMSNGGHTLTFRDPETFERLGSVQVRIAGRRVRRLNELECVDGLVWANVWQDDTMVRIDPATGNVTATVDASELRERIEVRRNAVLNGIAYRPDTGQFYITGKNWPSMFVTEFVPPAS